MSEQALSILCVADGAAVAQSVQRWVRQGSGLTWAGWIAAAAEIEAAVNVLGAQIVLLCLELSDEELQGLIGRLAGRSPQVRVVMLREDPSRADVERSLRAGAAGYLTITDPGPVLAGQVRDIGSGQAVLSARARAALDGTGPEA